MAATIDELLALHQETCEKARAIMRAKNYDYTSGSIDPYANFRSSEVLGVPAELGVLVRVMDKLKRIQTFVTKGDLEVKSESVDDAISDIVNYMILVQGLIKSRLKESGITQTMDDQMIGDFAPYGRT